MTTCNECGTEFEAKTETQTFCSAKCRKTFNNRRMTRGAVVYDLLMAKRYDRKGELTEAETRKILEVLAADFREKDNVERAGRQSWADPIHWVRQNPWVKRLMQTTIRIGRRAA